MNRQQAEHLLDAYGNVCSMFPRPDDDDAFMLNDVCESLREVILDAMTSYGVGNITTTPHITWPSTDYLTVPTYWTE